MFGWSSTVGFNRFQPLESGMAIRVTFTLYTLCAKMRSLLKSNTVMTQEQSNKKKKRNKVYAGKRRSLHY